MSAAAVTLAPAKRAGPPLVVGVWRGRYLRFAGQQFVLLAAPTRSGKGVGIVIPNLLSYEHSAVVLDVKQENFAITAGFRAKHGHAVYLFNPFAEDFRTARYNPLSAIADGIFRVGDILAIGYALYPPGGHDSFWNDSARNLFLGLALLLCELRDARAKGDARDMDLPDYPVTIGEVLRQSSGRGQPVKQYLASMLANYGAVLSGACVDALNRFLANDDKVLASILATFNAPLTIWANPVVDAATSANDFDLRDVRRTKMTVYLGITPDHLAESAILLNLMFSQLVNLNTKALPQDDQGLKYQCLMLMDEFTSIGKVGIIAKAVSYMAGYNLRLLAIIQSVAQLESVYGREDARTFATNCAMQLLYPPREQKDANEYSEMLGYFTQQSVSVSRPRGWTAKGGSSENISGQRRALLLPQELKELGQDREIILLENTKPILANRIVYYRDPVFQSRVLPAPVVRPLDVAGYQARVEYRLRDLVSTDLDAHGRLTVPVEHLEILADMNVRGLPDSTEAFENVADEDVPALVDWYFTGVGVPAVPLRNALEQVDAELAGIEVSGDPAPLAPGVAQRVLDNEVEFFGGSVEVDTDARAMPLPAAVGDGDGAVTCSGGSGDESLSLMLAGPVASPDRPVKRKSPSGGKGIRRSSSSTRSKKAGAGTTAS
ncbi:type IV secretory system conjugative DNA transfer family protein [Burkholderia multivorans]|uniref:type IV secretory system conjugative DNA transfer family protein n=1 Tax=Burkholderia multivorans TaxID=87883 RepID=UPI001C221C30|nr:type IV secretory system conjugative DNA transfer family protein [Burkholderia multivorans]MBU9205463.1 type IV secretory system conjugative DNA transfer family protein [Burkholderia multivorans]MCO8353472.1 type IV secretory system conjugative DNA transfer family protein [Burkholderia multivorans]MCO8385731.1 type IV secretory system conjugative DNA transfer family protein [Burkholderia multivorans]MCO8406588.1 type IV secretory system conjugative DNA transfer family protein [Burkholderia m